VLVVALAGSAVYLGTDHRENPLTAVTGAATSALTGAASGLVGGADTLRVTGTPGLRFAGSFVEETSAGDSVPHPVAGAVPQSYPAGGSIVSTSLRKQGRRGTLRVELLRRGRVVERAETAAANGLATIGGR